MAPSLKMFMAPAVIFGLKALKIDFAAPENLVIIRSLYFVSVAITVFTYFLIGYKVSTSVDNRQKKLKLKEKNASGQEVENIMTYADYDKRELQKLAMQFLLGAGVTVFIHFKWSVVPALILQAVMGPMNLSEHPLAKIYLFGKDAKRPFKDESNPLAGMFKQPQAAVEEVEGSAEDESTTAAAAGGSAAPKSSKNSKVLRLETESRKKK